MSLRAEVHDWVRRRRERPLPVVRVGHGPVVPGSVLRLAAVCAVAGLVWAGAARTTLVAELEVAAVAGMALWALVRPGTVPAHTAVVLTALLLLGSTAAPFDPAALWLAPAAYVAVRLGWWAGQVGWRTRVEVTALRRTGSRDLVLLGLAVAVGGAAWAASGATVAGLALVGGGALLALAWRVLPR
ncbi:hypothetical protein BCE75_1109 [Isoptericola sp. CG 20/1183]|uniref:Uncharacterized protein n=1 Tax=Isoptericola halotolerans TaxID=300560 RepID=A0ABX5EBN0_9MICO|nr:MULTISPECIES: hypothetical protein [Isoptericola]MCK0115418.1 hypothetical protein [Isoptericola sp. S6320L]PRZ04510.1 hypothetical protein BCL65_110172 [Isoptericola halotolerans]PRZ04592.1 hypothetical protein BCE75_1109 [Isoptericola sp. CG 20/1183]